MASIIGKIGGTAADVVPIRRALLSVSDKTGLVELGRALAAHGVELLSTGGTAKALRAADIPVVDVADYTGFPEMLGGRVKTLHPKIHGGIMYVRGNAEHEASIKEAGIKGIDLVVLNLYAFDKTVKSGADFGTCVENVDIGGPSMLRSSAKNHAHVAIATAPDQYAALVASLAAHGGGTPYALRKRFAAAAFAHSRATTRPSPLGSRRSSTPRPARRRRRTSSRRAPTSSCARSSTGTTRTRSPRRSTRRSGLSRRSSSGTGRRATSTCSTPSTRTSSCASAASPSTSRRRRPSSTSRPRARASACR